MTEKCDLYILKFILHDWDDESAVKILESINKVMKQSDTLIVIDAILESHDSKLMENIKANMKFF